VIYQVLFSEEAEQDLLDLYDYIADHDGEPRALAYIERIEEWCASLRRLPRRGTSRDDIRPGLRTAGFERRITVAFQVTADSVIILRILYGGRDADRLIHPEE
jgi:toxin ParE1/3/4